MHLISRVLLNCHIETFHSLQRIEAAQGDEGIYFSGELLTGAGIPSLAQYAQYSITKHFPGYDLDLNPAPIQWQSYLAFLVVCLTMINVVFVRVMGMTVIGWFRVQMQKRREQKSKKRS